MSGVLILHMHPEVATRDCEVCKKYIHEDSGVCRVNKHTGGPVLRAAGMALPCQTRTGCPKISPEANVALSDKNLIAYNHYMECKATGDWPDDGVVKQNAGIISMAEGIAARAAQWEIKQNLKMNTEVMLTFLTGTKTTL